MSGPSRLERPGGPGLPRRGGRDAIDSPCPDELRTKQGRRGRSRRPPTSARPAPPRERRPACALPYAMVAPLVVFIGALAIYPTVLTVIEAFFHSDPLTPPNHFVGFGNFAAVFCQPPSAPQHREHRLVRAVRRGAHRRLRHRDRPAPAAAVPGPGRPAGHRHPALGAAGRGRGRDLVVDLQPDVRRPRLGPEEPAPHRPVPALHRVAPDRDHPAHRPRAGLADHAAGGAARPGRHPVHPRRAVRKRPRGRGGVVPAHHPHHPAARPSRHSHRHRRGPGRCPSTSSTRSTC